MVKGKRQILIIIVFIIILILKMFYTKNANKNSIKEETENKM